MTISETHLSTKSPPPGFDSAHPPAVYVSAECDGSREAAYATDDIAWLHTFAAGKTATRIFGRVLEEQRTPIIPAKNEVGLPGAKVLIQGLAGRYQAVSDDTGSFSFDGVPAGEYTIDVTLSLYHLTRGAIPIKVAAHACAEVNPRLVTDGAISGTVLDRRNRPVPGLEIQIARLLPGGELRDLFGIKAKTDDRGRFLIEGLPHGDFLMGVNLRGAPIREVPYPTVYYPGVSSRESAKALHLDAAQHISDLKLSLPDPYLPRDVTVAVVWPDGTPAGGIQVFTDVGYDDPAGVVVSDTKGKAAPPCLKDLPYRISARYFIDADPTKNNRRIMDGEVILPPGRERASLRIVLNRPGVLP